MIKVVGFIDNRFVCGVIPNTTGNRNVLQTAIRKGFAGAIMRI